MKWTKKEILNQLYYDEIDGILAGIKQEQSYDMLQILRVVHNPFLKNSSDSKKLFDELADEAVAGNKIIYDAEQNDLGKLKRMFGSESKLVDSNGNPLRKK